MNAFWIIALALILYLAASPRIAASMYARLLLFRPRHAKGDRTAFEKTFKGQYEQHWIRYQSGSLRALFFPVANSKFVCMINMGRDGDIERRLELIAMLRQCGMSVFVYEYPGFGRSSGRATLENVCDSGVKALDFMTSALKIPAERIVLFGESLGVAVSTYQLQRRSIRALILKSGFFSLKRAVKELNPVFRIYPDWLFPARVMDNALAIEGKKLPVLVAHGAMDRMIPVAHARDLAAIVPGTKLKILPQSRHGFMPEEDIEELGNAIRAFLGELPEEPQE